jgi:hypothetical protein
LAKKNGNKSVDERQAAVNSAINPDPRIARKYEKVAEENTDFKPAKALFDNMVGEDNKEDMRILMSNIPVMAKPLMVNLEVAEEATNPLRTKSLARIYLEKMLVYNVAVDRGGRDDAIAVGQSQAEEQAANLQGKALMG